MSAALVIAYYFPPVGGAGSQRWLKFARYLPDVDASPFTAAVLTGPGTAVGRWTPLDESLVDELPDGVQIHRVPGPEPTLAAGWQARSERWIGARSSWTDWWVGGAVTSGLEIGADVDVIVASMSPYSSAMVAADLSRRLDKPWVADLRDPWALDEMRVYPTRLHRQLEQRQMRRLLSTAAAVVTTTEEAVERMHARFPELARTPIVSIPNGFDRNDFSDPPPPRDGEAFRIVHTGYLHTDLGTGQRKAVLLRRLLGGGYGADILTRSHAYLLQAIELLLVRRPELRTKLELHLAGVLSPTDHELAQDSQVVREHGYLRHGDAVELMRSADLLFLPMQNLPTGVRSGIVPGKTYEYLAAGRPILAAIPEGDARDILAEAAIARICDPDDVPAMMAAVEAEFECRRLREPLPTVPSALLERFERRNLADRYATLLASVAGLRIPAGRAAIA